MASPPRPPTPTGIAAIMASPKSNGGGGSSQAVDGTSLSIMAEFSDKKFWCPGEMRSQMGFTFKDATITKVEPGKWADSAGLRVGDEIVLIQTRIAKDPIVERHTRQATDEEVRFTPFYPLTQTEKIIRLKNKAGVGFVVTRRLATEDLESAVKNVQAVFRGKKERDKVTSIKREKYGIVPSDLPFRVRLNGLNSGGPDLYAENAKVLQFRARLVADTTPLRKSDFLAEPRVYGGGAAPGASNSESNTGMIMLRNSAATAMLAAGRVSSVEDGGRISAGGSMDVVERKSALMKGMNLQKDADGAKIRNSVGMPPGSTTTTPIIKDFQMVAGGPSAGVGSNGVASEERRSTTVRTTVGISTISSRTTAARGGPGAGSDNENNNLGALLEDKAGDHNRSQALSIAGLAPRLSATTGAGTAQQLEATYANVEKFEHSLHALEGLEEQKATAQALLGSKMVHALTVDFEEELASGSEKSKSPPAPPPEPAPQQTGKRGLHHNKIGVFVDNKTSRVSAEAPAKRAGRPQAGDVGSGTPAAGTTSSESKSSWWNKNRKDGRETANSVDGSDGAYGNFGRMSRETVRSEYHATPSYTEKLLPKELVEEWEYDLPQYPRIQIPQDEGEPWQLTTLLQIVKHLQRQPEQPLHPLVLMRLFVDVQKVLEKKYPFPVKHVKIPKRSIEELVEEGTTHHGAGAAPSALFGSILKTVEKGLQPAALDHESMARPGRLIVVGDTHGQLEDVLWIFYKNGLPSPSNAYLFNGDIADRGFYASEIFVLVYGFMLLYPDAVDVNRGNHEDLNMNLDARCGGFYKEVMQKYGDELGELIFNELLNTYTHLPLATVLENRIFIVHGGLSRVQEGNFELLESVEGRGITMPDMVSTSADTAFIDALWADPTDQPGIVKSSRGPSMINFGPDVTAKFCAENRFAMIVRSHQPPKNKDGVFFHHEQKLLTVFSASNYCGWYGNTGAVLIFTPSQRGAEEERVARASQKVATFHGVFDPNCFRQNFHEQMQRYRASTSGRSRSAGRGRERTPMPRMLNQPGLAPPGQLPQQRRSKSAAPGRPSQGSSVVSQYNGMAPPFGVTQPQIQMQLGANMNYAAPSMFNPNVGNVGTANQLSMTSGTATGALAQWGSLSPPGLGMQPMGAMWAQPASGTKLVPMSEGEAAPPRTGSKTNRLSASSEVNVDEIGDDDVYGPPPGLGHDSPPQQVRLYTGGASQEGSANLNDDESLDSDEEDFSNPKALPELEIARHFSPTFDALKDVDITTNDVSSMLFSNQSALRRITAAQLELNSMRDFNLQDLTSRLDRLVFETKSRLARLIVEEKHFLWRHYADYEVHDGQITFEDWRNGLAAVMGTDEVVEGLPWAEVKKVFNVEDPNTGLVDYPLILSRFRVMMRDVPERLVSPLRASVGSVVGGVSATTGRGASIMQPPRTSVRPMSVSLDARPPSPVSTPRSDDGTSGTSTAEGLRALRKNKFERMRTNIGFAAAADNASNTRTTTTVAIQQGRSSYRTPPMGPGRNTRQTSVMGAAGGSVRMSGRVTLVSGPAAAGNPRAASVFGGQLGGPGGIEYFGNALWMETILGKIFEQLLLSEISWQKLVAAFSGNNASGGIASRFGGMSSQDEMVVTFPVLQKVLQCASPNGKPLLSDQQAHAVMRVLLSNCAPRGGSGPTGDAAASRITGEPEKGEGKAEATTGRRAGDSPDVSGGSGDSNAESVGASGDEFVGAGNNALKLSQQTPGSAKSNRVRAKTKDSARAATPTSTSPAFARKAATKGTPSANRSKDPTAGLGSLGAASNSKDTRKSADQSQTAHGKKEDKAKKPRGMLLTEFLEQLEMSYTGFNVQRFHAINQTTSSQEGGIPIGSMPSEMEQRTLRAMSVKFGNSSAAAALRLIGRELRQSHKTTFDLFREADTDRSGCLSKAEFIVTVRKLLRPHKEYLKEHFLGGSRSETAGDGLEEAERISAGGGKAAGAVSFVTQTAGSILNRITNGGRSSGSRHSNTRETMLEDEVDEDLFDENDNGRASAAERSRTPADRAYEKLLEQIYEMVDLSHDGQINYFEFLYCFSPANVGGGLGAGAATGRTESQGSGRAPTGGNPDAGEDLHQALHEQICSVLYSNKQALLQVFQFFDKGGTGKRIRKKDFVKCLKALNRALSVHHPPLTVEQIEMISEHSVEPGTRHIDYIAFLNSLVVVDMLTGEYFE